MIAIYIYAGVFFLLLILTLVFKAIDKKSFKDLNKKEHPLTILYPFAASLVKLFRKIIPENPDSKIKAMLKSIYVKENVSKESFIYQTKKVASCMAIIIAVCFLGLVMSIASRKITIVNSLDRNAYGKGTASYQLEIDYNGKSEEADIVVDPIKLSEEEILQKFDDCFEDIKIKMLGENESLEHVSKKLVLISEYKGIDIYWEIEDSEKLKYNGEISVDIVENEEVPMNLFATLSLDDVKETFVIPVILRAKEISEKEKLIQEIKKTIDESNSIFESKVTLPKTIEGKEITFKKTKENNSVALLILALIAVFVIFIGFDKSLEEKVKKRNEEMMIDYTEIVSKLSLLYEAGLSILKAWERIVADYEKKDTKRFAYQEMKLVLEKVKSGVSEGDAYLQFGQRCGLHPYIKLGNILEQNLSKGSKGMKNSLKMEVSEAFEERKRLARKKGEEASTKLLIPMVLMLVVVIAIIAVPALMSMNI